MPHKAEMDEGHTSTLIKLPMGNEQATIGSLERELRLQSEFATGPDHPANQTVSATFPLLFSHFTSVSAICQSGANRFDKSLRSFSLILSFVGKTFCNVLVSCLGFPSWLSIKD
jgi:hypothetical protein